MKSHCIGPDWIAGSGSVFHSYDPATEEVAWTGKAATGDEIERAIRSGREAFETWREAPFDDRARILERWAQEVGTDRANLAEAISRETGKPDWEAAAEVRAVVGKVGLSLEAHRRRRAGETLSIESNARGILRYRPHGVLVVFGPFNFPAHLPNGHLVPALLEGNVVILKPSEKSPLVGQRMMEIWERIGAPPGVLQCLQGGRDTGVALASNRELDGILFTGSFATGAALQRLSAEEPGRLLALEMGGNNPLVVHDVANTDAAVLVTIQSAYATAGQRCSCARRLIVPRGRAGDDFVERLTDAVRRIRVGPRTDRPEPFFGPLIDPAAVDAVVAAEEARIRSGGRPVVPLERSGHGPAFLRPGLVDVTESADRPDEEVFGPLLQLVRTDGFEEAVAEANRTRYGLVASLLSDRKELYDVFLRRLRAGLIHWNRPTTGASGRLPFGGLGRSGNHRPAGFFSVDYCSDPVASIESEELSMPETLPPGIAS